MKRFISLLLIVLIALVAFGAIPALAGQSKYATGTSSAAVTFGPDAASGKIITSIYAATDKAGGSVKVYTKLNKTPVSVAPTNAQTVIAVSTNLYALTTSDLVCYVHADGVLDVTTVASATVTNITLAAGLSAAGTTSDDIYKLQQSGQLLVGLLGTSVGTNAVLNTSGEVFIAPPDSPIYIVVDGTSNAVITATSR